MEGRESSGTSNLARVHYSRLGRATRVVIGTAFLVFTLPAAARAVTVSVLADGVTITGANPGATIVLVGAYQHTERYRTTYSGEVEILTDTDRDGRLTFAPATGIPHRSVWAAIDAETGAMVTGAMEGYPISVTELPPSAIMRANDRDTIAFAEGTIDLTVVRPGKGAWRTTADRAGRGDTRAAPNQLSVAFADLHPIHGAGLGPQRILPSDVVVAINPRTLALFVATVGQ